jgi:hypothetical protein
VSGFRPPAVGRRIAASDHGPVRRRPRFGSQAVEPGGTTVLWTILVILLVLWLLGLVGSIGGAFIHLLLVLAIIVFLVQMFSSRGSSSV